jgi:hypothetical protein
VSANIDDGYRSTVQKGDETQIKGIPRHLATEIVFQRSSMHCPVTALQKEANAWRAPGVHLALSAYRERSLMPAGSGLC